MLYRHVQCMYIDVWPICALNGIRRRPVPTSASIGVSFEEAETAFSDDYALVLPDPDHSSSDEGRLVLIGLSSALRVLLVVYCERARGEVLRLISARRATRSERAQYDARWKR